MKGQLHPGWEGLQRRKLACLAAVLTILALAALLGAGTGSIRLSPGEVLSADRKGIVVACAEGAFGIVKAQFAGGRPLSAADIVNGRKIKAGDVLE